MSVFSVCICVYKIFCIYVLTFKKKILSSGEIAFSWASLKTANGSAWNISLICKLTNSTSYLLHLTSVPQEAIFFSLCLPRARYQATRDQPYHPKPTESIQTTQSLSVYTVLQCLFWETPIKALAYAPSFYCFYPLPI